MCLQKISEEREYREDRPQRLVLDARDKLAAGNQSERGELQCPPPRKTNYPPFTVSAAIIRLVAEIGEHIGRLSLQREQTQTLRLRRINRIRSIQGSLAIEGNTLSEAQITAILDGKRVIAPPREIQEARNAINAYEQFETWQAANQQHLLQAHQVLMAGLIDDAGRYRAGNVGVMNGDVLVHMAPPASRVKS